MTKKITPPKKIDLKKGYTLMIRGTKGAMYLIARGVDNVVSCTCPSWLHMPLPVEQRVCKHIRENIEITETNEQKFDKAYGLANIEFEKINDEKKQLFATLEEEIDALTKKAIEISEKTGVPYQDPCHFWLNSDNWGRADYLPKSYRKLYPDGVGHDSLKSIDHSSDIASALEWMNYEPDLSGWQTSSC